MKIVSATNSQTSGQVIFEYAASPLKARTMNAFDHQSVARSLNGRGTEFYTFKPNPDQKLNFILRILLQSTEWKEIMACLWEKGVVVCHTRQLKGNVVEDGVRVITLPI